MQQQLTDRLNNLKNRTDRDYEFAGESQRSYDKGQIDILEEIQSLGAGWIPVTERLPTEYGRYMTYAPMLEPHYIIYFDGNEWIAKFPEKITHWMPLPLPPKQ